MRAQERTDPTVVPMVPVSPMAWQPLPVRRRGPLRWLGIAALALVLAVLVASFIHLPYYLESPGDAGAVSPLIVVDPAHRHPVSGEFLLSTVSLQNSVTALNLVTAWFNPNVNVVRRQDVTQGVSDAQYARLASQEMDRSKQDAIVVALRRLGYTVPEHGDGALVANVEQGSPATGHLHAGDVIVAADGKPVAIATDLTSAIRPHHPGEVLKLEVVGATGRRSDSVRLASCPEQVPGCQGSNGQKPFVGIEPLTKNDRYDYPFKVDIDLSNVGGPSAGLAFALGVIDALTSGHLTGGHRVGVTGTISRDGTVGPIGGIALKTVAVENAGADVFLVPRDDNVPGGDPQYRAAAAKAKGHHLKVIAVGTLEEALTALRSLGGNMSGIGPPPSSLAA
jgi:PDZ domain-containing protein